MNEQPGVVLVNPKYPHNVGAALRACAAFGADKLWVTGNRAQWEHTKKGVRLPREERMDIYTDKVELIRNEKPFDYYGRQLDGERVVPIAVEVSPSAEPLATFEHPPMGLYVFGPEDGSIPRSIRVLCHRFIIIPSDHCLNLASAVSCVLMDRRIKRQLAGLEPIRPAYETMQEERG